MKQKFPQKESLAKYPELKGGMQSLLQNVEKIPPTLKIGIRNYLKFNKPDGEIIFLILPFRFHFSVPT